jgi:hypothetical protein
MDQAGLGRMVKIRGEEGREEAFQFLFHCFLASSP